MKYSGATKLRSGRRLLKVLVPDGTNYHNCLAAVDGKHVAMKKPPKVGSFYYDYKGFHSIILMAVVNAGILSQR